MYTDIFTIIFYFILIKSESSSINVCESHNLPDFNGKMVSDFPLATYQHLQFVWHCTRRCWEDYQCRSYMFNRATGLCLTFAVGYSDVHNTFNPISHQAGAKLYTICGRNGAFGTQCIVDGDCNYDDGFCKNGRCECSLGYSYNPTSGSCVTRCAVYGDAFVEFRNHAISYINVQSLTKTSAKDCINQCKDETTFVCTNVEFRWSDGQCNLANVTWFEVDPEQLRTDELGWSFFNRHCDVQH